MKICCAGVALMQFHSMFLVQLTCYTIHVFQSHIPVNLDMVLGLVPYSSNIVMLCPSSKVKTLI